MIPKLLRARNPLKAGHASKEQAAASVLGSPDKIEAASRGDAAAFMALYYAKARAVAAYIAPLVDDDHLRSVQLRRTFLRAWRELPSLERPEEFDLWLLRLAHAELEANSLDASKAASADPAATELFALPARLRETVCLRYFFGLSAAQIAQAFETSVADVDRWTVQGLDAIALSASPRSRVRLAA